MQGYQTPTGFGFQVLVRRIVIDIQYPDSVLLPDIAEMKLAHFIQLAFGKGGQNKQPELIRGPEAVFDRKFAAIHLMQDIISEGRNNRSCALGHCHRDSVSRVRYDIAKRLALRRAVAKS